MNDTIDFYTLDGKIYLIVKEINFNNHKIIDAAINIPNIVNVFSNSFDSNSRTIYYKKLHD